MQIIENTKIKEKLYIEKLDNGLTVLIIPKKDVLKKYIIWGTHYGSNDSEFVVPGEKQNTVVPDGVAHFLEHKMFEQENGINSLDALTMLGVEANAYTTNDHTAYLYSCTDNFYEALDEFMDYVQNPYFTDENVEKEKGIIGQEITMYDDDPDWRVYLNTMKAMYHNSPVKLDITGTIETISHIDKEILYKCYNTFYNPSNMVMAVCGDFNPDDLIKEIKKRIIKKEANGEIKRIYPDEPESIVQKNIEQKMEVSQSLYSIGIKDKVVEQSEKVKRHIAVEILFNIMVGKSSKLYQELYNEGLVYSAPNIDYEFSDKYAHVVLMGQSNEPEKVYSKIIKETKNIIENGVNKEDFDRIKKKIYGSYVIEYNDVEDIARMFMADYFKGINSFEYIEEIENISINYINQLAKELFNEDKIVLSIVRK